MIRLWREPLVHFLLGGTTLFLLYAAVAKEPAFSPDRIVVGEERVASLASTFERTWLRPPTRSELDLLVQDFVDEEILYWEALALGLDRDDLVVRRRMRQKMEFLHVDLVDPPAASDDELSDFLAANVDRFQEPARLRFRQIFVNPELKGSDPRQRAQRLLAQLRAGDTVVGDPTQLPEEMEEASAREVAAAFGTGFAEALFEISEEGWGEPVASSFGLHLVHIEKRTPGRLPRLAEIREQIDRELRAERREGAHRRFLETLRSRYDVEIQLPERGAAPPATPSGR